MTQEQVLQDYQSGINEKKRQGTNEENINVMWKDIEGVILGGGKKLKNAEGKKEKWMV